MNLDHLPKRHYRVIYADPPWKFSAGTKSRPQHYQRMEILDIISMKVSQLAHPDGARLALWIPIPLLHRLPEVLKGWGFRYSSSRVWVKIWQRESPLFILPEHSIARGNGLEVMGNAELLVIAKRGRPQSIKGNPWTSVMFHPRREHSRKPDAIRDELAYRLEGPRLELFARQTVEGWDVAGNETTKFGGAA